MSRWNPALCQILWIKNGTFTMRVNFFTKNSNNIFLLYMINHIQIKVFLNPENIIEILYCCWDSLIIENKIANVKKNIYEN